MASKKIIMVLPPLDFDGTAYQVIRRALESRGHTVAVTSIAEGGVTASDGVSAPVNVRLRDVKTWDYDAFIFVGGEGARLYFDDEQVRKLAKDVKYKTVGATGSAVAILALAEVLNGKKATGPHELVPLLTRNGATFTNQMLQVDDKIVTLQDTAGAEQFANAIAKAVE